MDNRAQSTGSAAWVVAIVAILAFITGVLLLTAIDPVIQALFDSPQWTADTADGQNALDWAVRAWAALPASILVAILIQIWIDTRQPV